MVLPKRSLHRAGRLPLISQPFAMLNCRTARAHMNARGLPSFQVVTAIKKTLHPHIGSISTRRARCPCRLVLSTPNCLRYASPPLLIPCRVRLRPLEFCRGTTPSHVANCLPLSKFFASPPATSTMAASGPMPGTFSRRWVAFRALCHAMIWALISSTCSFNTFKCSSNRLISSRKELGNSISAPWINAGTRRPLQPAPA